MTKVVDKGGITRLWRPLAQGMVCPNCESEIEPIEDLTAVLIPNFVRPRPGPEIFCLVDCMDQWFEDGLESGNIKPGDYMALYSFSRYLLIKPTTLDGLWVLELILDADD